MRIEIISFGFLHNAPPVAHMTFDLRRHFRDPHVHAAMCEMTGEDTEVQDAVLSTTGIPELVSAAVAAVRAYASGPSADNDVVLAFGCAGGRHRAHVVASEAARLLSCEGYTVDLYHRDVHRDVVERDHHGQAPATMNFNGPVGRVIGSVETLIQSCGDITIN